MKILYFDCFAGVSGDMTLGALLDLGIDQQKFLSEMDKLNVNGFEIKFGRVQKNSITAFDVNVILNDSQEHSHEHEHAHIHIHKHEHSHEHCHRNLFDVNHIIENSEITDNAKALAKRIFKRVAEAEAIVHGKPLEEVHFHEVGALDSIVDIVGTAICIDMLKPDRIVSSVVNDGFGFVECQHGKIPVPVPATVEIFANSNVISRQIDLEMELVTPTGAAIIAELCEAFGERPEMVIKKIGVGAGKRSSKIPNVLRVAMGETMNVAREDTITVIETNIDDCSSEVLAYTMERLLNQGARDVFYTPVMMKKNRPAYLLTVLCDDNIKKVMQDIIFKETTTIGVRMREEKRICLKRQLKAVSTCYGELITKRVFYDGHEMVYPEYESARLLAEKNKVSLKQIYDTLNQLNDF